MLLNSHLLSEIELVCDRVVIIDGGRVVTEGRPQTDALERAHAALDRLASEWRGRIERIDRILDEDKGDS